MKKFDLPLVNFMSEKSIKGGYYFGNKIIRKFNKYAAKVLKRVMGFRSKELRYGMGRIALV